MEDQYHKNLFVSSSKPPTKPKKIYFLTFLVNVYYNVGAPVANTIT